MPLPPRISEVWWGDCACCDERTCVAHQIGGDPPARPTDSDLAEIGAVMYARRLRKFAERAVRFELARHALERSGDEQS